jgi:hypothetical protein
LLTTENTEIHGRILESIAISVSFGEFHSQVVLPLQRSITVDFPEMPVLFRSAVLGWTSLRVLATNS